MGNELIKKFLDGEDHRLPKRQPVHGWRKYRIAPEVASVGMDAVVTEPNMSIEPISSADQVRVQCPSCAGYVECQSATDQWLDCPHCTSLFLYGRHEGQAETLTFTEFSGMFLEDSAMRYVLFTKVVDGLLTSCPILYPDDKMLPHQEFVDGMLAGPLAGWEVRSTGPFTTNSE